MRRIFCVMPILLLAAGLPAFSVQPETPTGPTHRIQVFRAGKGEPRTRDDAAAARTASPRDPAQGRTRPYQAAKPPSRGKVHPKAEPASLQAVSLAPWRWQCGTGGRRLCG